MASGSLRKFRAPGATAPDGSSVVLRVYLRGDARGIVGLESVHGTSEAAKKAALKLIEERGCGHDYTFAWTTAEAYRSYDQPALDTITAIKGEPEKPEAAEAAEEET